MKITKIERKEVEYDVRYLQVDAGVRYWDDAEVDGNIDEEGKFNTESNEQVFNTCRAD